MEITKETVEKLGRLAKIELQPEEIPTLQKDLSNILNMVEQLEEVNTDGVEPTSQVTGLENVTREDKENYTFEKSDMLATMPDVDQQGNLRVHAVFTGDSPSN